MHEYSIAEELLTSVNQAMRDNGATRAVRVVVTIGPSITEEPLRMAFDAAKRDTAASQAELVLERAAEEAFCLDCGSRSRLSAATSRTQDLLSPPEATPEFSCPVCGGTGALLARSSEATLTSIELEV